MTRVAWSESSQGRTRRSPVSVRGRQGRRTPEYGSRGGSRTGAGLHGRRHHPRAELGRRARGKDGVGRCGRSGRQRPPQWEAPPPSWLMRRPNLLAWLALTGTQEPMRLTYPMDPAARIVGANMAFKRTIFEEFWWIRYGFRSSRANALRPRGGRVRQRPSQIGEGVSRSTRRSGCSIE